MITETVDAGSFVSSPASAEENFGDSLRWQAGPLLGGLDWLLEQLTGCSPIEVMVAPLAGDWVGMDTARIAWATAATVTDGIAENYAGLASDSSTVWVGDGATAFQGRMTSISDSFTQYGDGCRSMSEATGALVSLAKTTAELIVSILGILGDALTRIAAQACVPVIGWVTGAIDGGITAARMVGWVDKAVRAIQKVIDFVEKYRVVIAAIARIAAAIASLAKAVTALANMQITQGADDATATAFGVTA